MANDKVEKQLAALKSLREAGLTEQSTAQLRNALTDRVSLVVAKAAQICGELHAIALFPDLKAAFEQMFESKDAQCWAKNALAKTLKDLGLQESAFFLRGIRHVQMEPVWGGSEDTAATLRGICAMGLVQCTDLPRDEVLRCLIDALVDKVASVRGDAVRSLEQMGGREVLLLLRLKARLGDEEPRVAGEVLEAILHMEGQIAIPFVTGFLQHKNEEVADEAALALGASRLPQVFDPLKRAWEQRPSPVYLRALSLSRLENALDFLLNLLEKGRRRDAEEALYALELHKGTEDVVKRVEEVVRVLGNPKLTSIFHQRW
jgi:HEAT repeat protein